jgi:hypothetical protein
VLQDIAFAVAAAPAAPTQRHLQTQVEACEARVARPFN